MSPKTYSAPGGDLGQLYQQIASYYKGPVESELERITKVALGEGAISSRSYLVIQVRTPFQGIERMTLKQVGRMLNGISGERVKQLEYGICNALQQYLPKDVRVSKFKSTAKKPAEMPFEPLMTAGEVAEALNVHVNTVRRWSDNGRLPSYRLSERGDRRFKRQDVIKLLEKE
jgi:excisionase family DNA binding protein